MSTYSDSLDCIFSHNFASKFGGAIFAEQNSAIQNLKNCNFYNNSALISGGAI